MRKSLFQGSVHAYRDHVLANASARAKALSDTDVGDAAAATRLVERLVREIPEVARLSAEEKDGKRRTVTREIRDYGASRTVDVVVIDVSIPFVGAALSFEIAPSHSHVISEDIAVEANKIIITLYDDDSLDSILQATVSRIEANLERLRTELQSLPNEIANLVNRIVSRRREEIAAQKEKDSKRSFPIR